MPRPLKVFTVHSHASYVPPHIINDVIGAPSHIRQGNIYVVARTKKDASAFLDKKLGGRYAVSVIDEARGNHFDAFMDGTAYLDTDSPVFEGAVVVSWGRGSQTYAAESINGWVVVGETTHIDPENERNLLKKPVFVAAAPVAKPVRITIELDADTDPAIVAEITKVGMSVIVASGIDEKATGTVIES